VWSLCCNFDQRLYYMLEPPCESATEAPLDIYNHASLHFRSGGQLPDRLYASYLFVFVSVLSVALRSAIMPIIATCADGRRLADRV